MKNHFKTITTSFLVLAGLAYAAPSAKAYSYTVGDTFLGFWDNATSQDYLIYIGNEATYNTSNGVYTGAQITLNTANLGTNVATGIGSASTINADLTTAFGSGWATNSAVQFGVIAALGSNPTPSIFATDPGATSTTPQSSYNLVLSSIQTARNDVSGLAGVYGSNLNGGATSTTGELQTKSTTQSYFNYSPSGNVAPGASFNVLDPGIDTPMTGGGGASAFFDELNPTNHAGAAGAQGSELVLGQFTVASNGTITYAAPVPEPSTYAMMGIGCLMLVVMARRRASKVAA